MYPIPKLTLPIFSINLLLIDRWYIKERGFYIVSDLQIDFYMLAVKISREFKNSRISLNVLKVCWSNSNSWCLLDRGVVIRDGHLTQF